MRLCGGSSRTIYILSPFLFAFLIAKRGWVNDPRPSIARPKAQPKAPRRAPSSSGCIGPSGDVGHIANEVGPSQAGESQPWVTDERIVWPCGLVG